MASRYDYPAGGYFIDERVDDASGKHFFRIRDRHNKGVHTTDTKKEAFKWVHDRNVMDALNGTFEKVLRECMDECNL